MGVNELTDSSHFAQLLQQVGSKTVFVDFYATWCSPCQVVAPFFEELSNTYPQAVFIKIDVDKLSDVASANGVSAMPTFMCFQHGVKKDVLRGMFHDCL